MFKLFKGKKTYTTAAAAILGAAAAYTSGAMPGADAVQLAVTALLAAFVRNGMPSNTVTPE